ncbi:hypothetical protein [Mycobacterium intracellulare]|nr:hypothetical protein [Mycobacterium intracellulare]
MLAFVLLVGDGASANALVNELAVLVRAVRGRAIAGGPAHAGERVLS